MKSFLHEMIQEAGEITLQYRNRIGGPGVDRKSKKDLVTEADVAVERFLIERIGRAHPGHGIFGEETGRRGGDEYQWVIDPIDGTTSYVHGQPYYSVSIGLRHDGRTILAAVYAPALGELFEAAAGEGATLNGQTIQVSKETRLEDSLLATGFACLRDNLPYNNLPFFLRVLPQIRDIRRTGSAAIDLSYIACGRLEGFWELNLKPYDIAAGELILTEAGGKATDFSGGVSGLPGEIVATNGRIHDELVAMLSRIKNDAFGSKR